ncbi:NAD kinase, partial [Polaribacter sp.]|nr:NAD kinase [Polaribacter sp.]
NLNIPILGINTGRLGFLAIIPKDKIEESFELVFNNKYSLQKRTLLAVETEPKIEEFDKLNFALNEVTIAKKNSTSMIGVTTLLDNQFLTNYWADGAIFSTPTGSTGYSLSCNGPVVLPNSRTLIITPIAPHNLNVRPITIPDNINIKIEVETREDSFLISLDSRQTSVPKNTKLSIEKANFTIHSVLPENQTFLKTLRSKLFWGEDIRNAKNS